LALQITQTICGTIVVLFLIVAALAFTMRPRH